MNKKISCVMAATLVVVLGTGSLSGRTLGPGGRGMGYISFGLQKIDTNDFQSRLDRTTLGYPVYAENYFALGGGGLFCGRHIVLGGEGQALIGEKRYGGGYQSELSGGYGLFLAGYPLINTRRVTLYPLVGIGGGLMTWKVQRELVPSTFEDVIVRPEMGASLLVASFMLQAGLGVDYWIRLGGGGQDRGAMCIVIGLRAGYTYATTGDKWELEMYDASSELLAGPELGITGPFVRILVGWGGVSGR